MYDPKDHVVHCVNGCLHEGNANATTTRADVRRLIEQALAKGPEPELVIHLHGGLVDQAAGYGIAERLCKVYDGDARYPIFFVWESGLLESIRNNLQDISHDRLFQQLVKRAVWWVMQQVPAETGLRGAAGITDRADYNRQFDDYFRRERVELPDALDGARQAEASLRSAAAPIDIATPEQEEMLAKEIEARLRVELDFDPEFRPELEQLHNEITAADLRHPSPKKTGVGELVGHTSQIAPQQVDELFDISPESKGVFTLARVAWFLAKIVVRVLKRLLTGRGHGIYTTVVEEVLAGVYVDKIGGVIWGQMKKDTEDACAATPTAAGSALLAEIQAQQQGGKKFKRITLIGHSTGAVYICNLLAAAARDLPNQKFEVIFLAPAVTYEKFAATLRAHAARIEGFRRFGMMDAVEADDVIVPVIYLRSLLYFVSGLLEFTATAAATRVPDMPLVGMQRYGSDHQTYDKAAFPDIWFVEDYIGGHAHGSVWSVTVAGTVNGIASQSRKHGDFDDDPITLASIVDILGSGYGA